MLLALLTVISVNPTVIGRMSLLADIQAWEPLKMHRLSEEIAAKTQAPKRVLTLAPLLALEGGGQIYPELSCGSIIYRIGDRLTPAQQHLTRTIGPKSLKDLIEGQPANALIVGAEDPRLAFLELPLKTIVTPEWGRQDYSNGLTVYRPPLMGPSGSP